METTRIINGVSADEFKDIINRYSKNIVVNHHALDHVSDCQRRIFNINELIRPLLHETPAGIGLQANGRYAVFYRRKYGFIRIILEIKEFKLEITTFLNTDCVPNIRRLP